MGDTVADYPDAVRRIVTAEVPSDATTEGEVERALKSASTPQLTSDIIEDMTDAVLTEDKVIEAFEGSGELPTQAEIGSAADALDDYDMSDRQADVVRELSDRVATVEDVADALSERRQQAGDRPIFREDVEGAVDSVAQDKEFVGRSPDDVAGEEARELGAPSRSNYEQATVQAATQADSVSARDVFGDDATDLDDVGEKNADKGASVIRSESGDAVAVYGAPTEEVGQAIADETGAEYMTATEVTDDMRTAGAGETVDLTLRGRKIGEVDV